MHLRYELSGPAGSHTSEVDSPARRRPRAPSSRRVAPPVFEGWNTEFSLRAVRLKPRYEVEDQHGAPLADDDAAQIPGIMQRLWERRWGIEPAALGGGSAMRRHPSRVKYDRSMPSPPTLPSQVFHVRLPHQNWLDEPVWRLTQ
jgi:hypothetical protein